MGELHVNMNITLDGVIQANGGPSEQDAGFEYAGWERPYGDEESGAQITEDVAGVRRAAAGADDVRHLPRLLAGQTDGIGQAFDRVPKYVASRGTPELSWDTSTQVTDAGAEVRDLRERHEQIHTWGSANLLQTLFREGLVDQVNLWVCPVVIGQGKKLFPEGTTASRFELVEPPKAYPGGATLLRLRRLEGPPETMTGARQP